MTSLSRIHALDSWRNALILLRTAGSSRPNAPGSVQNGTEMSNSQSFRSRCGLVLVKYRYLYLIMNAPRDAGRLSEVGVTGRMTRGPTMKVVSAGISLASTVVASSRLRSIDRRGWSRGWHRLS